MKKSGTKKQALALPANQYSDLLVGVSELLDSARRASARAVNALMTATYWEIGRRLVEHEQGGAKRAAYGEELLKRLAQDLSERFGRGFSRQNLQNMRQLYLAAPPDRIRQTLSGKSTEPEIRQTASGKSAKATALRGGWNVRQLKRQMDSQFYERIALSRSKAAMLAKGAKPQPTDAMSADEELRNPLVLEFLGLRDEYSESDLEDALIHHLETFLLELGNDFAFIGRQRRLRIDDEWYRVDLLFFHRTLRCLVIFDLKLGRFTHADAGQMHMYLNYAREHWVQPGENPPVGIILCSGKGEALVRFATDALPNKLLVREYLTALPDEKVLSAELEKTRKELEHRSA